MTKNYPGYKFIQTKGGISEYRLIKNDLTVLVLPDHYSPTATLMVTYKVGSRNEVPGNTGSTHILEHLMFKGSKKFNKKTRNNVWSLENLGARMNATTWLDRTNYYETVPIEHLELSIAIEADRMRNAMLKAEDLKTEMTVVRNEFERGENDPTELLDKEIWAAAFSAHPYHHSTIGWKSDIENSNVDQLKKFYDTFYHPNNATVTIIGDIKIEAALSLIKKYFGVHPKSKNPIPEVKMVEPTQTGFRRITVSKAIEPNTIALAWKIPEALHKDTHALQLLSAILTSGKSSVLYRTLVDHGFATNVRSFAIPTRDPGLFTIYASLSPGIQHADVEKIILETLSGLITSLDKDSIDRAKKILEAEVAFSRDGSYAQASYINEAIALGDWRFFLDFISKIKNINKDQIIKVLEKYFTEDKGTIGYYKCNLDNRNEK